MMWTEANFEFCKNKDEYGSMMWMDGVHVKAIYDFIMANHFREIVEVGCWDGFSTSAIAQALRDGKDFLACCVDLEIRPLLRKIVAGLPICCYQGPSLKALAMLQDADCVLLDGDHSLATVTAEAKLIMAGQCHTIIAHDVGIQGAPGPIALRQALVANPNWRVWIDDAQRDGMATQRGLMIATRSEDVILPCEMVPRPVSRKAVIDACQQYSVLNRERLEALHDLAVSCARLQGSFVECGCGFGGSGMVLASVIEEHSPGKTLYMCDTFEGLPRPDLSVDRHDGWSDEKILSVEHSMACTFRRVAARVRRIAPSVSVVTVPGTFDSSLPPFRPGRIAMLHADADWYSSTMDILNNLFKLMLPGGVVVFDDFNFWRGCKQACHEYFERIGFVPEYHEVSCAAWLRLPATWAPPA